MANENNSADTSFLDQIRDSLAETLRDVERQEQSLADSQLQEQGSGERTVIWHHTLDRLGDRFRDWGDKITHAIRRAAQVEQVLTDGEAQLARTRAELRRIAEAVARGPGGKS